MSPQKLHIGMLAPLKRPINSWITASRPHIIYQLISRLVKRGHKVSLFGPGDSQIDGVEIIPIIEKALINIGAVENPFYQHTSAIVKMLVSLKKRGDEFDIIHNHLYPEFLPLLIKDQINSPMLTTVHAQMTDDLVSALKLFPDSHLVFISKAHAKLGKGLNFDIVYNGIDIEVNNLIHNPTKDYLLFLGRMTGQKNLKGEYFDPKGVTTAIEVAKKLGEKLYISGNVESKEFYDNIIKGALSEKIHFIGPVSSEQPLSRPEVVGLMQNAKALLFPINWEEPFGLVMVEANACGTPVIAFNHGSVPEIIRDGVNGFVVSNFEQMCEKIGHLNEIDSLVCRNEAVEKFSLEKMVENYERMYYKILNK